MSDRAYWVIYRISDKPRVARLPERNRPAAVQNIGIRARLPRGRYPLDGDNFAVQPPIVNNDKSKNSTDDRHGIVGYLDDVELAKRVVGAF